jgi:hypothetical protein
VNSLVTDLSFDVTTTSAVTGVEVVAVIVLVGLLVERELLRALEGRAWEFQARTLDNAVVPMLAMFALLVVRRFLELA